MATITALKKNPFNPLNASHIPPGTKSFFSASNAIQAHFDSLGGPNQDAVSEWMKKLKLRFSDKNTGMLGAKGKASTDLRVAFYTNAINDLFNQTNDLQVRNPKSFEQKLAMQDKGAGLTWLERESEPGRNPRMDKRPIEYDQRFVHTTYLLLDAAGESGMEYTPAIVTFDLGSRLSSLPILLGTTHYYMTYGKHCEPKEEIKQKNPNVISVQQFNFLEALAISYYVAASHMLFCIGKDDVYAKNKLKKALEGFESAIRIKYDYPDALEGLAYVSRLTGNRKKADELYGKANRVRVELENNEFARQYLLAEKTPS